MRKTNKIYKHNYKKIKMNKKENLNSNNKKYWMNKN